MSKNFDNSKFYKSKAWRECRQNYIKKRIIIDGGICERCGQHLGYILHHKIVLNPTNINDLDIKLNEANLEYLCHDCHNKVHYEELHGTPRKMACVFDEQGNPIDVREI